QQTARIVADEVEHLLAVGRIWDEVDLIDDDDNLFAPLANPFQKGALAFTERAVGAGDKEHQIAARDKKLRDLLVALNHGVRAWGVHQADLAQPLHRHLDCEVIIAVWLLAKAFTIAKQMDATR